MSKLKPYTNPRCAHVIRTHVCNIRALRGYSDLSVLRGALRGLAVGPDERPSSHESYNPDCRSSPKPSIQYIHCTTSPPYNSVWIDVGLH